VQGAEKNMWKQKAEVAESNRIKYIGHSLKHNPHIMPSNRPQSPILKCLTHNIVAYRPVVRQQLRNKDRDSGRC
jgi:hypothetical protein